MTAFGEPAAHDEVMNPMTVVAGGWTMWEAKACALEAVAVSSICTE